MSTGEALVLILFALPYIVFTACMLIAPMRMEHSMRRIVLGMAASLGADEKSVEQSKYNWVVHWLCGLFIIALYSLVRFLAV